MIKFNIDFDTPVFSIFKTFGKLIILHADSPRLTFSCLAGNRKQSYSQHSHLPQHVIRYISADNIKSDFSRLSLTPLDIFIRNQRVMQSLGLNVIKVINAQPLAIGYAPESVRDKMANLTALDLNAPKVVNAHPAAISYAPESVRDKMANLTALGLNAAKVVNAHPSALGYAPELVREKIRFLQRSAKLLKWQYFAEDLVSARPVLLGYSTKKLAIFRRLAAYHLDPSERTTEPNKFSNALILPLEQYIIALNRIDDDQTLSVTELAKMARQIKLSSSERKQMLDEISPSLGRIGIMYSAYRDK